LNRLAEAENLARTIVHEFVTAGLTARAITALAYLAESISTRKATPDLAHDVHEYVISLRATPERDFGVSRGSRIGRSSLGRADTRLKAGGYCLFACYAGHGKQPIRLNIDNPGSGITSP